MMRQFSHMRLTELRTFMIQTSSLSKVSCYYLIILARWQDGKYFYPSDQRVPGTQFPVGLNTSKHFRRFKGLGSLDQDDVYNAFYDKSKRRLYVVTTNGIDFSMRMVEDIDARKEFLYDKNILSNPYNFKDL